MQLKPCSAHSFCSNTTHSNNMSPTQIFSLQFKAEVFPVYYYYVCVQINIWFIYPIKHTQTNWSTAQTFTHPPLWFMYSKNVVHHNLEFVIVAPGSVGVRLSRGSVGFVLSKRGLKFTTVCSWRKQTSLKHNLHWKLN